MACTVETSTMHLILSSAVQNDLNKLFPIPFPLVFVSANCQQNYWRFSARRYEFSLVGQMQPQWMTQIYTKWTVIMKPIQLHSSLHSSHSLWMIWTESTPITQVLMGITLSRQTFGCIQTFRCKLLSQTFWLCTFFNQWWTHVSIWWALFFD